MAGAGANSSGTQGQDNSARRLIRRSVAFEVLTFVAVILISPASFVFGLPLGIAPSDWLASWTHWTVVFIIVAIAIAVLGFETALSYRLKAQRITSTSHA